MDPPSHIRHLPLRYNRLSALPLFEGSHSLDLLDVSPSTLFFRGPQRSPRTIITADIESETFSNPIVVPIPDQFEIEQFKLIDPFTAIAVLQSTHDYGRRIAVLSAFDSRWEEIELRTLMEKEWIHKQHLDLLIHFNQTTFYIVESHKDCIPIPHMPDFSDPLHTFYKAKLNDNSVDIRSMGSVTDDMEYGDPFSSFLPDTNKILMVKTLFNLDSLEGGSQIGTPFLDQTEGCRIRSITLYLYTVDILIESIDRKNLTVQFPPNLHVCTDSTMAELIGNELVFSQPGGCIMYNIEEETFTKYTMEDPSREYQVKSVMGGKVLLGVTNDRNLFRGYLKTVPSLHEMTHSIVQTRIPSYPSEDLSISKTHSLIRSLFH